MSVIIKTVNSRKELKEFVKFPLKLYKNSPYYVPGLFMDEMAALDPAKNPMSKYAKFRLFLAYTVLQAALDENRALLRHLLRLLFAHSAP